MDRIDKAILEILQEDSRVTNQELADKVALSPSPCLRRVHQLEAAGYIRKHVAILAPQKLGLTLSIILLVGLASHDAKTMEGFEAAVVKFPEVVSCDMIAGQSADYMLKIVVPGMKEYQDILLNKITRIPGVSTFHSSFVLRTVIERTALPLNHLK